MIRNVFHIYLLKHILLHVTTFPPYILKLGTFDVICVLLVFSGKVITQLRSRGTFFERFVHQIVPDHSKERMTITTTTTTSV